MDSPAGGAGVLIAEFSGNALRCLPVQTRWLLQEGLPPPPPFVPGSDPLYQARSFAG